MTPGTYQLDIQPQTNLGAAFAWVETTSAWATATAPIPIARFTLVGQGPTFGGAPNLGLIGPTAQSVSGFLDPGNYQSAVALYQFSVPGGQTWQFDAKVLAHAINSPLLSTVTLFDSNGDVLATRSAGGGSGADSTDPELVQGLGPGTYFLGVSAAANVPGQAGGYDPESGKPGTAGVIEPAGSFELKLSATPTTQATRLVDFNLDYADSFEPSPTGLDLTFSGPVDVTSLSVPDRQETALTVVDSSGRSWPISAVSYQSAQDRLSFIFNEALPPGRYTLIAPTQGGLTDLSGRTVAGPLGNPSNVLASWTVAAPTGPSDPNNLGVLWPGLVNVTWDAAVSRTTTLAAGQTSDERFVVICPGFYGLQTQTGAGSVDVRIENSQGATVAESGNQTQLNRIFLSLAPGVYHMQITDAGSGAASVWWTLKPLSLDYEKILGNGVGQSPALGLSLVGPEPSSPEASANAAGPDGATAIATATGAISTGTGTAATPFAASPIPSVLLVTMETGLAGLPSPDAGHTAAVGPLADGATVALADASHGLPAGFRYASSSSGTDPRVGEGDPADGPDAFPPPSLARSGSSRSGVAADGAGRLGRRRRDGPGPGRSTGPDRGLDRRPDRGHALRPRRGGPPRGRVGHDAVRRGRHDRGRRGPGDRDRRRSRKRPSPRATGPGRPRRPVHPAGDDVPELPALRADPQVVAAPALRPCRMAAPSRIQPERHGRGRPAVGGGRHEEAGGSMRCDTILPSRFARASGSSNAASPRSGRSAPRNGRCGTSPVP